MSNNKTGRQKLKVSRYIQCTLKRQTKVSCYKRIKVLCYDCKEKRQVERLVLQHHTFN